MTSTAQQCADIHNTLVSRVPCPIFYLRRNLVTILQTQQRDTYNDLQGTQLVEFLSLSDEYNGVDTNLMPQVRKPDPAYFLDYRDSDDTDEYLDLLLLYPDPESDNSGDVIYDTATDLATWVFFPPWPRVNEWVPLEAILSKWIEH
ncbi:MAG: hypothetical protein L6R42_006816 [Xanthoria sp. 1 TBL-2021]|nr:MAG: hypothetical protein L6R42_006816 [Xanthoria sp. 1 TBL-2021]